MISMKTILLSLLGALLMAETSAADDAALRKAVTFYASFDEKAEGDFGGGDLQLWTRSDDPAENGKKVIRPGYDRSRVGIVKDGGISGGALEIREQPPDNAFIFFKAGGKLPIKKGGWGGAVSLWVKADLSKIPTKGPWDPFLLVQQGWNNGAVWCDFAPGETPRDLRIGLFPTLPEGKIPPTLEEGEKIWLTVKKPAFKPGVWHHLAQTWGNFDSGKADGWTACYLDGKLVGKIAGRDANMTWDAAQVRFHIGSALVGMIDEVALFSRTLSDAEVQRLHAAPDVLQGLKMGK